MPERNKKNPVLAVYFDNEEDKEFCRNMVWTLKYKTGKNINQIVKESLMKYSEDI